MALTESRSGQARNGEAVTDTDAGVLPPVPGRTRRAFWWLERFAPAIGARWATELWCTVPDVDLSTKMPPPRESCSPLRTVNPENRLLVPSITTHRLNDCASMTAARDCVLRNVSALKPGICTGLPNK